MKLDLLIINANIVTVDDNRPQASSIGIYQDRIIFVGNDQDAKRYDARKVINAAGKTIVPGFNDAHQHMSHFCDSLRRVNLSSPPIESIQDILDAVASRAAEVNPGDWIIGAGYDQNKLYEKRHPLATELDRAAPNNPVMLQHTSGHMMSINTALIKLARVIYCVVPSGVKVVLDHGGRPTGLILEQAQDLISTLYKPHSITEVAESLRLASTQYLSEGITSCQEAGVGLGLVGHTPVELSAFQNALENNHLEVRVNAMIAQESLHYVEHHASAFADKTLDLGLRTGFGDDWLRISNTKVFADGSLIGRTCAMFEPFANDTDPENNGFFKMDV